VQSNLRSVKTEMVSISCPDAKQSEAFVSTISLFMIFASSPKEEKAHLRLPTVWRDLWEDLTQLRKHHADMKGRDVLKELQSLIAQNTNPDSETFDVAPAKADTAAEMPSKHHENEESMILREVKELWSRTISTPLYSQMLPSRKRLPIWSYKARILESIASNQVIILCGETGACSSILFPQFFPVYLKSKCTE